MEWLKDHKTLLELLFGGIGTAIIGWIFFRDKAVQKRRQKQIQRSGDSSINIQAGGSVHMGDKTDGRDSKTK